MPSKGKKLAARAASLPTMRKSSKTDSALAARPRRLAPTSSALRIFNSGL